MRFSSNTHTTPRLGWQHFFPYFTPLAHSLSNNTGTPNTQIDRRNRQTNESTDGREGGRRMAFTISFSSLSILLLYLFNSTIFLVRDFFLSRPFIWLVICPTCVVEQNLTYGATHSWWVTNKHFLLLAKGFRTAPLHHHHHHRTSLSVPLLFLYFVIIIMIRCCLSAHLILFGWFVVLVSCRLARSSRHPKQEEQRQSCLLVYWPWRACRRPPRRLDT